MELTNYRLQPPQARVCACVCVCVETGAVWPVDEGAGVCLFDRGGCVYVCCCHSCSVSTASVMMLGGGCQVDEILKGSVHSNYRKV